MSHRFLASMGPLAIVIASVSVAAQAPKTATATAPAKKGATSTYTPPRTPWGDPDLQGVYDYQSIIPMERPPQLAGKARFTDAELRDWAKAHMPNGDSCGFGTRKDEQCTEQQLKDIGAYNEFWNNRNIVHDNRTSLIEDPPDGRFPPMTPEAQKKQKEILGSVPQGPAGPEPDAPASWEDFSAVTRCIAEQTPNGVQGYNSGTYIMQSPGWVMIVRERLDTRIIPLDGRPHIGQNIRQWQGDSRGHFEGNTLVVDTTNFTDKQNKGGVGATLPPGVPMGNVHVTERFVPVSATRIEYHATVEDPKTWTRSWTFMLPWEKNNSYQIYEYACHEGNISLENVLRDARALGR